MFKLTETLFGRRGIDAGLLILRLTAGTMIMTHGIQKIANFGQLATGFADPIGLGPKTSVIIMILTEVGAAAMIMLGLLTRLAAIPLVIGLSVAAFVAHAPFVFSESEMPLLYAVVFLALLFTGAGRYSLDSLIHRRLNK